MIGHTLILGDCMKVLQQMNGNSVDSMVTDPPYGWRFMGKAWDHFDVERRLEHHKAQIAEKGKTTASLAAGEYDLSLKANLAFQAWTTEWAREVYRVLKPGGHILVFCGPRTYHRMASGVEDAGFEVRDQMQWLFGSGFPKSLDISKAIDKAAGAERTVVGEHPNAASSLGNGINMDGGKAHEIVYLTAPSTDAAKQYEGYGTALKPANEPILLARKPLSEKTVAANVLKHGTGGINIDGCRIGSGGHHGGLSPAGKSNSYGEGKSFSAKDYVSQPNKIYLQGRFPANLVLSHDEGCETYVDIDTKAPRLMECTPTCAVRMLDEQSGILKSNPGTYRRDKREGDGNTYRFEGQGVTSLGDSGGASRFFYCAKASKSERNLGCEGLPLKASQVDLPQGGIEEGNPRGHLTLNHHPTVKPLKLMRYLCRLVTPQGGVILDPFTGSGSTGVAAIYEGFHFIGIEREEEYLKIALARLDHFISDKSTMRMIGHT